jgi:hypothetical protein
MARRIMVTFDESSSEALNKLTERGKFSSTAAAVRKSLEVTDALQQQVSEGFTEIVVRNPKTNQQKIMVIPGFK